MLEFEPIYFTKRRNLDFGRLDGSLCRIKLTKNVVKSFSFTNYSTRAKEENGSFKSIK